MSYTTFEVRDANFKLSDDEIIASVQVNNTGTIQGTEVIQMYAGFKNSKLERPFKTLCGFQRVPLEPQESKRISITCPVERLKYYDIDIQSFKLEHIEYELYIGTSSADEDLLCGTITI